MSQAECGVEISKCKGIIARLDAATTKAALLRLLPWTSLIPVKRAGQSEQETAECCPEAATCPLSHVEAGTVVCVKQLTAQPDVIDRLREMGLGEQQRIRLISRHPSLICQVCNARVALSQDLAKAILVEPLSKGR
jgi:Fe2+ transport system protein FeoA